MNFSISRHSDRTEVRLEGDLFDGIDTLLRDLAAQIPAAPARVAFFLDKLGRVNSMGVRQWLNFVRALSEKHQLDFVECPVSFFGHALMMPGMLGNGKVTSFKAPFSCDVCKTSAEVLVDAKAVRAGQLPKVLCSRCSSPMAFEFDEGDDLLSLLP